MKFGQHLTANIESEWKRHYLSYKSLKRIIKAAVAAMGAKFNPRETGDLSLLTIEFTNVLLSEAAKIESFYLKEFRKYSEMGAKYESDNVSIEDDEAISSTIQTLNDLDHKVCNLYKFCELNQTGIRKILKKYDKKLNRSIADHFYTTNISVLEFQKEDNIHDLLERIRKLKSTLADVELKRHPSAHTIISSRKQGINDALTKDDPEMLEIVFSHFRVDIYQVMESAAAKKALKCISWLTEQPKSWTEPIPNSLYSQYILHRIVSKSGNDPTVIDHLIKTFHSDTVHTLLLSQDEAGRRPMHYAAVLGYDEIVRILLDALPNAFDLPGWGDNDGHSPLDLAIMKGNENVARIILEYPNWGNWQLPQYPNEVKTYDSGNLLLMACSLGHSVIVKILLDNDVDIFSINDDGENTLHIAASNGHMETVKLLVSFNTTAEYIDSLDKSFGRTALMMAAMKGYIEIVKYFITCRAKVDVIDSTGTNSHEHAVYRGHLSIASILYPFIEHYPSSPLKGISDDVPMEKITSEKAIGLGGPLKDALIHLYLGSLDSRIMGPHVKIDEKLIPLDKTVGAYSLIISAKGARITSKSVKPNGIMILSMPLSESLRLKPISLECDSEAFREVEIYFDVLPIQNVADIGLLKPIARATILLASPHEGLWKEKSPIGGRFFAPFICSSSMKTIGTILSEIVVVTPFSHPRLHNLDGVARYWTSLITKIIGHRGLGMNRSIQENPHLQLHENTIESLTQAGSLGAEYVEFDVQLTKDNVPVLYHDLSELDIHVPVNAVKLSEFLSIRPPRKAEKTNAMHSRSKSAISTVENEKLKVTSCTYFTIQHPFATLEEALKIVPKNTGFNIEVKYPNTEEAEKDDLYHQEINLFCDRILDVVFTNSNGRKIYFSSFHPEICLMLCKKQHHFPVFYLTEGGTGRYYDDRLNSLRSAVDVANRCGCLGIVTASDPIIEAPRLIEKIRRSGLLLFTYGSKNNIVENVKIQTSYGADAIICDKVRQIYSGIRE